MTCRMTGRCIRTSIGVLTSIWWGCAPQTQAGRLVAPTGIAQLQLPMDAAALRCAADEEAKEKPARRRDILAGINRQLLMPPPDDAFAPELFDFMVVLAPRMESGTVDPAWASYLYTTYQRRLREERPDGRPRRPAFSISPSSTITSSSIRSSSIHAHSSVPTALQIGQES